MTFILAQDGFAQLVERHVRCIEDAIAGDGLAPGVDRLGHRFGGGAAVAAVELDAEVFLRAAGVVAGGKDDAAEGLVFADHARSGWCGQDAAASDQHLAEAVRCRHLQDDLDRRSIVIAPIAAQHQRRALGCGDAVEDGLDEVFQVVGLLENGDFLAQAGSAGFLVGKWLRGNGADAHQTTSQGELRRDYYGQIISSAAHEQPQILPVG